MTPFRTSHYLVTLHFKNISHVFKINCQVLLCQEVLVSNTELISHHQPEEFGKGQKETPHVQPPPRILADIHLG